jgi:hypothetical protein
MVYNRIKQVWGRLWKGRCFMDSIIIEIKCDPKYRLLNELRDQGLLFDSIRQALNIDDEGLQELTDEQYELLESLQN